MNNLKIISRIEIACRCYECNVRYKFYSKQMDFRNDTSYVLPAP